MVNKIFNPKNGRCIILSDNFGEAVKQKIQISFICGTDMFWFVNRWKPTFSSRNEYIGYTDSNGFNPA